jgi:hypothetical protein
MFIKDPNETLNYILDFTSELAQDTISTSTWVVPSGITQSGSATIVGRTTQIVLRGGTTGAKYKLVNTIVTAGGNTIEKFFYIYVVESYSEIVDLEKVENLTGIDAADIKIDLVEYVDEYVRSILNRDFHGEQTDTQVIDIENLNDFIVGYDGVRDFVLRRYPVVSVQSVSLNPDPDSITIPATPTILTVGVDYFVNLGAGVITLSDDLEIVAGQRKIEVQYTYGFTEAPPRVKAYANMLLAKILESEPSKNAAGQILSEIEIGRYREKYADIATSLRNKYDTLRTLEEAIIKKYKDWDN